MNNYINSGVKKIIAILFFLLAAFAVAFLALYPSIKERKIISKISDFESCARAGYPIMESYPRQCGLPDGRFFTEKFIGDKAPGK